MKTFNIISDKLQSFKYGKPLASIIVIGIFLVMAFGSEESTNTKVRTTECDPQPELNESLLIEISGTYPNGFPIDTAPGTLFLVFQRISDTTTCQSLIVSQQTIPFVTDAAGRFTYETPVTQRANDADLWRAEVYIPTGADYTGFRMTQVAKYGFTILHFNYHEPRPL